MSWYVNRQTISRKMNLETFKEYNSGVVYFYSFALANDTKNDW